MVLMKLHVVRLFVINYCTWKGYVPNINLIVFKDNPTKKNEMFFLKYFYTTCLPHNLHNFQNDSNKYMQPF
jgi:hypothetical protein